MPQRTLEYLRQQWKTHRNPVWLFPAKGHNGLGARTATEPMSRTTLQRAFRLALQASGIKKANRVRALLGQPPLLTQAEEQTWQLPEESLEPPSHPDRPIRCPLCQRPMGGRGKRPRNRPPGTPAPRHENAWSMSPPTRPSDADDRSPAGYFPEPVTNGQTVNESPSPGA